MLLLTRLEAELIRETLQECDNNDEALEIIEAILKQDDRAQLKELLDD